MDLKQSKNIKVYGTLVNDTVNTDQTLKDSSHNDALINAYQVYDARFNAGGVQDYQDNINKRVTDITYDPLANNGQGGTTITNLIVDGVSGISLGDLDDVDTSDPNHTPQTGQVLKFDGTNWVPGTDSTGTPGTTLNQPLSSINSASLGAPSTANAILMWNGSAWVYTTIDAISFVDSDIDNTPRTLKQWITYVMNNASMWEADANILNHIKPKNSQAVIAPGITSSTFGSIAGALTVGGNVTVGTAQAPGAVTVTGSTTSAGFYDSSISAS